MSIWEFADPLRAYRVLMFSFHENLVTDWTYFDTKGSAVALVRPWLR